MPRSSAAPCSSGKCYGSPIAYNGKLYMQTEKKLYCFGKKGQTTRRSQPWCASRRNGRRPGEAKRLQIIPNEVLLRPGEIATFRVRSLDANGFTVEENVDPKTVKWETFIPPTALVKVTMKGAFDDEGQLVADKDTGCRPPGIQGDARRR